MQKRQASKSTLFLMEIVIVILIFSLCAAVCLSLFAASDRMSEESDALNHAVVISKNAAGCFKSAEGDYALLFALMEVPARIDSIDGKQCAKVYYDNNWEPATHAKENGYYLSVSEITHETSMMEVALLEAEIAVYDMEHTPIFQCIVKTTVNTGRE